MFLIITRDTMFFTAMKNILSKGNVVHIQNEEEIDVMLHQNAFVIIDTLMNNVFHSNFLTQIERLKPVHVIIFSPFNIKRCLGKVPVTFVPRTITIIDFVALINGSYCSVLMNPLMILVKIIKLRWIHILSYDQMVSRKINNQTTRCANSIFYTTLFTNSAPNYT